MNTIIGKERYRRSTPDRRYQALMREALKDRLESLPAQLSREEVGTIGAEIGLGSPEEAARLFGRLKGVAWRGEYVDSEDGVWVAARVAEVR